MLLFLIGHAKPILNSIPRFPTQNGGASGHSINQTLGIDFTARGSNVAFSPSSQGKFPREIEYPWEAFDLTVAPRLWPDKRARREGYHVWKPIMTNRYRKLE
jgi:hypothetical protein